MVGDATLIVVTRPSGHTTAPADERGTSGDTSTMTTLVVQQVVHGGAAVGQRVTLRQFGGCPGTTTEESEPIVEAGCTDLLFLRPFEPGRPTGQYVEVDPSVVYQANDRSVFAARSVGGTGMPLPQAVTVDAVAAAVRESEPGR